LTQHWLQCHIS